MALLLVVLSLWGCASRSTHTYMRPESNLDYIRTIGVLPFENLGGGGGPAQRIRELAITEILASGLFDVVDKGRVDSLLREEALEPNAPFDSPTLKRLGQRLGVQAFVLGSVEQSEGSRAGGAVYPEIALTLRLIDCESGLVLWQSSGRESGYSVMDRLFGTEPKNAFLVSLELINRMLMTIQ